MYHFTVTEQNNLVVTEVDHTDGYKSRVQGHKIEFMHSKDNEDDLAQRIVDVLVGSILSNHQ